MKFEFDDAKDRSNHARHGILLSAFRGFDETAIVRVDTRGDYGETRFQALGRIAGAPYVLAFTVRGEVIRLISLRRAHEKEVKAYVRRSAT